MLPFWGAVEKFVTTCTTMHGAPQALIVPAGLILTGIPVVVTLPFVLHRRRFSMVVAMYEAYSGPQ